MPALIVPHPFGTRTPTEIDQLAEECVTKLTEIEGAQATGTIVQAGSSHHGEDDGPRLIEVADDIEAVNRLFRERRWGDGLPVVAPTPERVERMLRATSRPQDSVIAHVAPGFGAATVEAIAINAVLAGCEPQALPVLIAAVEAVADPVFNLQAIQATTNPVAVWLIVNGPAAQRLDMNAGWNCLGQGNWANATLGRALRLILQNVGGALPGEMDRSTHGFPGKFTCCCAENERESPWEPLHVERGFDRGASTVTVVGAEGTMNMNIHTKDPGEILRSIGETMIHPPSNEYTHGGEPWILFGPEHAGILARAGLDKNEIRARLWEFSKMPARALPAPEFERTRSSRRAELGEIDRMSMLPIAPRPQDIQLLVAGGPGTHSMYIPSFGNTRAITRLVDGNG